MAESFECFDYRGSHGKLAVQWE